MINTRTMPSQHLARRVATVTPGQTPSQRLCRSPGQGRTSSHGRSAWRYGLNGSRLELGRRNRPRYLVRGFEAAALVRVSDAGAPNGSSLL